MQWKRNICDLKNRLLMMLNATNMKNYWSTMLHTFESSHSRNGKPMIRGLATDPISLSNDPSHVLYISTLMYLVFNVLIIFIVCTRNGKFLNNFESASPNNSHSISDQSDNIKMKINKILAIYSPTFFSVVF